MRLSNYENVFKKVPEDDKSDEKDDEPVDPRTKKVTKAIENLEVVAESDNLGHEEASFQHVCAGSTIFARDLANSRGSVGTPEWME